MEKSEKRKVSIHPAIAQQIEELVEKFPGSFPTFTAAVNAQLEATLKVFREDMEGREARLKSSKF